MLVSVCKCSVIKILAKIKRTLKKKLWHKNRSHYDSEDNLKWVEISKYQEQLFTIKLMARAREIDKQLRALVALVKEDPGLIPSIHKAAHRPGTVMQLPLLTSIGIRNPHRPDIHASKSQYK